MQRAAAEAVFRVQFPVARRWRGIVASPIGGRGVCNWEGDQPNFGRGEVVFGPPGEGNKFRLSEGENGGGIKEKNPKIL